VTHDHDHHHVFFPDHHGAEPAQQDAAEALAWQLDNVELLTVGVDIGSSTSHLLFSRLHLQRLAQSLSSRFVVVERETVHRSPILLTPFRADGLIDSAALSRFIDEAYREAGLERDQVDTGAVILTGTALERANAKAVAELFAAEGGRFVCASAGHNMEAILAAHGSGAVAMSRVRPGPALHIDVGGGTAKLSLLEEGEILQTATVAVGGRLLTIDAEGRIVRLETAAARLAPGLAAGDRLEPEEGRRLCGLLADQLREAAEGGRPSLLLTRPLEHNHRLGELRVTFSGGVSEYLFGHEPRGYGDLARELAGAIRIVFEADQAIVESAGEGIRATVIGASQFTVEVSGNTVHVGGEELLPIHSVPVVRPILAAGEVDADDVAAAIARAFSRLDLVEGGSPAALAISWKGEPGYAALRALAGGVARGLARSLAAGMPVLLVLDADVGRSVGAILQEEFGAGANLIVLDGLELKELDYVDVGRVLRPAGVVPVIVKSLAFAKATGAPPAGPAQRDRRSRTGGRA